MLVGLPTNDKSMTADAAQYSGFKKAHTRKNTKKQQKVEKRFQALSMKKTVNHSTEICLQGVHSGRV